MHVPLSHVTPTARGTCTSPSSAPVFILADAENPINWRLRRKIFTVAVGMIATFNGVLGSSLPAGAIGPVAAHFHVTSKTQMVLPISVYQFGFVLGSLVFGPLSELYGRKIVFLASQALYAGSTLATALAPTWTSFLCFRWVSGIGAASTISVTGGLNADLFDNALARGRANALFLAVTTFGPQFAPLISGYTAPISWRWPFWISLIGIGVSFPFLLLLKETYAPVLLERRRRQLTGLATEDDVSGSGTLNVKNIKRIFTVFIARPLRMILTEAMVGLTCLYLAYATGIYYLFFQTYPLIFQDLHGLNAGSTGVAYLPTAVGVFIGFAVFLAYDAYVQYARNSGSPWASQEEYQRLPLACIGGAFCVTSLFWIGWTAFRTIFWVVPALAGVPFGLGFFLVLMALNNYLADAYKSFSASAMAAVSCSRSIGAALLPFAATPLYSKLGIHWATSLLAFLSLGTTVIPYVFIKFHRRIRVDSKFLQELAHG